MGVGNLIGRMARGTKLSFLEINALTAALENIENTISLISRFIKPGTNIFTVDALETSGGYVHIDADGITIRADENTSAFQNAYKFKAFDGGYIGQWVMYTTASGVNSVFDVSSILNGAAYGSSSNVFRSSASAGAGHTASMGFTTWVDGNISTAPVLTLTQDNNGEGWLELTKGYITINGWTWAGGAPLSPLQDSAVNIYMRADRLIIQYDDAGTVRYKYLLLSGTGATWVHTTVAP